MILSATNLNKHFHLPGGKVKQALIDVSFQLQQGEVLGIIGESGSGKTTLARIIAGLEKADSGTVEWETQEKDKAFLVQMVFQNPYASLYRGMKIKEVLEEPLLIQGLRREERMIKEALKEVGLSGYEERYPHQLSGGQRQRIALARALILKPSVLIADEPTSMLDISVQLDILNLLLKLKEKIGLSIILITHDLAVANYLCDRIVVLKDGLVIDTGLTEEIMLRPKDSYTKELVAIAQRNWAVLDN